MKERPNVLWIIADQWRGQALSSMGDENAVTPNLDALADEGLMFEQALSAHPLCVPFRASLLTGKHSQANGVPGHYTSLPDDTRTVAHTFADAGYSTAYFGKWHLHDHPMRSPDDPPDYVARIFIPETRRGGFEHWEAFEGGATHWDPWIHGTYHDEPTRYEGYQADVLVDRFGEYIRSRGPSDDPWFSVVSVEPPHDPYDQAPEAYSAHYDPADVQLRPNVPRGGEIEERARRELSGYYAHIEATDAAIGRLLRELAEAGMAEDTLVFFFSDHGDLLGSHGQQKKTSPLEESIRVPLIVRWPGVVPAGRRSQALISEIDFIPTTLSLVGIGFDDAYHGTDQSSVMRGERESVIDHVLIQYVTGMAHEWSSRIPWRAIRTADAMYGCIEGAEQWLYDLRTDPFQQSNRAHHGGLTSLRSDMRERLRSELERVVDPFPLPRYIDPPTPPGMGSPHG